jgi:aminoglycoside phosphotransferase (APT) family kinase protein
MLSYVEGVERPYPVDADIEVVLRRIRRFHDLVPGVCHNDLAQRNTVWSSDGPVFIDWDLAAPGRAIEDVAHACWQFLGLGPQRDAAEVAPVVRRAADAYGLDDAGRSALVDEIVAWQRRSADGIEEGAARGLAPLQKLVDGGAVRGIREARQWVLEHRDVLAAALA